MKKLLTIGVLTALIMHSSLSLAECNEGDGIIDRVSRSLCETWTEGNDAVYVPFHAYHMRFAYDRDKIDRYREDNWGLGYGRSLYTDSTWQGLYGMVFLDSHSDPEYFAGYGKEWLWGDQSGFYAGAGFTAGVTGRRDMERYIPFPIVLPIASVNYKKVSLNGTYVPGGHNNGNIMFFWSRVDF